MRNRDERLIRKEAKRDDKKKAGADRAGRAAPPGAL